MQPKSEVSLLGPRSRQDDRPRRRVQGPGRQRADRLSSPIEKAGRGCASGSGSSAAGRRSRGRAGVFPILAALLVFSLPAGPDRARASVSDILGVGIRGTAMGMAYTAVADDYSAAYFNPAGLAQVKRAQLTFQLTHAKARFTLSNRDQLIGFYEDATTYGFPPEMVRRSMPTGDMPDANGAMLGFCGDMGYLTGFKNLYFGLAMYIPFGKLVQTPVVFRTDVIPHFVRYFDALQGMDMHVALAYRPLDWLSVGVGLHSFLNLEGETFIDTVLLDLSDLQNGTYVLPGVNRQVLWSFAPLGSILIRPLEGLRVGLIYRGANKAKIKYQQFVTIGLPVDFTKEESLTLISAALPFDYTFFFTPESLTGGVSYQVIDRLLLSLDLAWYRYSAFTDGKGNDPDPAFSDILIPRAGLDFEALEALHVYAGYFFEPSPVPGQRTRNNYLDMDRHVLSCGVGYTIPGIGRYWKKPLTFQGLVQGQLFPRREIRKDDPALYGPSYEVKGYLIQAGLAVVFHY